MAGGGGGVQVRTPHRADGIPRIELDMHDTHGDDGVTASVGGEEVGVLSALAFKRVYQVRGQWDRGPRPIGSLSGPLDAMPPGPWPTWETNAHPRILISVRRPNG